MLDSSLFHVHRSRGFAFALAQPLELRLQGVYFVLHATQLAVRFR